MEISFSMGHRASRPPPWRALILADLCASVEVPHPVDLANAADVDRLLGLFAPRATIEVPDLLGEPGTSWPLTLEVSTLRDLSPASICSRSPAMAPAVELLAKLHQVNAGQAAPSELEPLLPAAAPLQALHDAILLCREGLAPRPTPATPLPSITSAHSGSDSADRLLRMVDLPGTEARAASAIGHVVGAIAGARRRRGTPTALSQALKVTAECVHRQLDAILHHPEVQRIEAIWRGLRFFADHTDFRKDIRLRVMHLPPAALTQARIDQLIRAEDDLDLVVLAYRLDEPADQLPLLEALARAGEAARTPVLLSVGPRFVALTPEEMLHGTSLEEDVPARPEYAAWNALRQKPCSRWLSVMFNRFLLRPPYAGDRTVKTLGYREATDQLSDHLWGDPVWVLASLMSQSFAGLGWATEFAGATAGHMGDLPVRSAQVTGRGSVQLTVECPAHQELVYDLAETGIIMLFSSENSDDAFVLYAPTAFKIPDELRPTRASRHLALPYQVVASRLARSLGRYSETLSATLSPEERCRALERHLLQLLASTGPGAGAASTFRPAIDDSSPPEAIFEIATGKDVLGGVELELRFHC